MSKQVESSWPQTHSLRVYTQSLTAYMREQGVASVHAIDQPESGPDQLESGDRDG
jgi:hypothetical protein